MKRSILFGVLAMFAVSALGVQNVNAQNEITGSKDKKELKGNKLPVQGDKTMQAPKPDGDKINAPQDPKFTDESKKDQINGKEADVKAAQDLNFN